MIIATVNISLGNTGIKYNTAAEIGTDKGRGTVLPTGEVLRGLGTHYASVADKERYDALVSASNKLRHDLMERFVRFPFFPSTFILSEIGEAEKFVQDYRVANNLDASVEVEILEGQFTELGDGLSDKRIAEWEADIKKKVEGVQLGRMKGQINSSALDCFEKLAACPALDDATASAIRLLVGEFRLGKIQKEDFQRSITLMDVKVRKTVLSPDSVKRSVPKL